MVLDLAAPGKAHDRDSRRAVLKQIDLDLLAVEDALRRRRQSLAEIDNKLRALAGGAAEWQQPLKPAQSRCPRQHSEEGILSFAEWLRENEEFCAREEFPGVGERRSHSPHLLRGGRHISSQTDKVPSMNRSSSWSVFPAAAGPAALTPGTPGRRSPSACAPRAQASQAATRSPARSGRQPAAPASPQARLSSAPGLQTPPHRAPGAPCPAVVQVCKASLHSPPPRSGGSPQAAATLPARARSASASPTRGGAAPTAVAVPSEGGAATPAPPAKPRARAASAAPQASLSPSWSHGVRLCGAPPPAAGAPPPPAAAATRPLAATPPMPGMDPRREASASPWRRGAAHPPPAAVAGAVPAGPAAAALPALLSTAVCRPGRMIAQTPPQGGGPPSADPPATSTRLLPAGPLVPAMPLMAAPPSTGPFVFYKDGHGCPAVPRQDSGSLGTGAGTPAPMHVQPLDACLNWRPLATDRQVSTSASMHLQPFDACLNRIPKPVERQVSLRERGFNREPVGADPQKGPHEPGAVREALQPPSAPGAPGPEAAAPAGRVSSRSSSSRTRPRSLPEVDPGPFAEGLEQWRPPSSAGSFQARTEATFAAASANGLGGQNATYTGPQPLPRGQPQCPVQ
uniref:Uncharacterized protein n=1 Tax=Alexandrium monilatum TaxID=311494 RepID=A0A7S4Q100_9DINO